MKKSTGITLIALAGLAALYYFWKSGSASGSSGGGGSGGSVSETYPDAVVKLAAAGTTSENEISGSQSTLTDAYNSAVAGFGSATINTRESIQAGVNVINSAQAAGIQLPSLSSTIAKISSNSNIARLADGSIKVVTVKAASVDSEGKTNFDRLYEKNIAASKTK